MRSVPPLAFTYPGGPLVRRHGPSGYSDVQSFRPWLRDEFSFRCVYCLVREQWGKRLGEFDLDHFEPVASSPEASLDYDNLVYSCHACNLRKGKRQVPDPTQALLESGCSSPSRWKTVRFDRRSTPSYFGDGVEFGEPCSMATHLDADYRHLPKD